MQSDGVFFLGIDGMNMNELHSVHSLSVWDILITFEDMKPTGDIAKFALVNNFCKTALSVLLLNRA